MSIGLIGQKCGMTRVFTEKGESIPVTVLLCEPNRVTQVKTVESDGYCAVQIAAGSKKPSRVNKALTGHFAKAGVEAGDTLYEFRLSEEEVKDMALGGKISVAIFEEGQSVDTKGVTKGKGFAGVVKRYNFKMQDATHGNSLAHRATGSIGQCQTPGRVFKGKKMAGQMGQVRRTVQNQNVVKVDAERNLLLIRGAVPGAPGERVIITKAVKGGESK